MLTCQVHFKRYHRMNVLPKLHIQNQNNENHRFSHRYNIHKHKNNRIIN